MPAYLLTLLAFALQQTETSLFVCVCVSVWFDCIDYCYIRVYAHIKGPFLFQQASFINLV